MQDAPQKQTRPAAQSSAAQPSGEPAVDAFAGYAAQAGRHDECRRPDGSLRPVWSSFAALLGDDCSGALRAAADVCARAILEQDVSMNVYAGDRSAARPWPLDVVPLLLSGEDWASVVSGLRQRARLYDAVLRDIYGPQKLIADGALPPEIVAANPDFLRACSGLGETRGPFVHIYAADVARSPDGRWWVIQDRIDAPSGLGYSLLNRILVRQALPETFQRAPVQRLYRFFQEFRNSLGRLGGQGDDATARTVILTPGPANETFFEQAYLSRFLGCPLVEGEDLTTRDGRVYLRTVGGLRRVDAILRRVDSEFCDPLELDPASLLGVPGLVGAALANRVVVANQLGGRAAESNALLAFLPPLCRHLLGEELAMPSAATWWCGQPDALDYVLENLDTLVVKPTFGGRGSPGRYGAGLDEAEREKLAAGIAARPWAWCGQERIFLGTTPGWNAAAGALRPMPFVARIYLAWSNDDYIAMPGGLVRCDPDGGEEGAVSLQAGSITKDLWVLDPEGTDVSIPIAPSGLDPRERLAHATPSRIADNLFWLGRYLERTTHLARLLEKLDPLLRDEIAGLERSMAEDAVGLVLERLEVSVPGVDGGRGAGGIARMAATARRAAHDPAHPGSLVSNAAKLMGALELVKVRMPPEVSSVVRDLRDGRRTGDPLPPQVLRTRLAALDGILGETLPHDTGWCFMQLGRHIERGCQMTHIVRWITGAPVRDAPPPSEFRLQTALHLADSLFAYRSVHGGFINAASVLGWFVSDAENPRSLRFQADRIGRRLAQLPEEPAPGPIAALRDRAFHLLSRVRLADSAALGGDPRAASTLWWELIGQFHELSDRISEIYFSHLELTSGG